MAATIPDGESGPAEDGSQGQLSEQLAELLPSPRTDGRDIDNIGAFGGGLPRELADIDVPDAPEVLPRPARKPAGFCSGFGPARPPDSKTCNICEQVFTERKAGVSKGATWWRCHPCHRAEERLRETAVEEGRLKIITDIKRKDKAEYKRRVMELARTHIKGQSQKEACTRLLDHLHAANFIEFETSAELINEEHYIDNAMAEDTQLTEADAQLLWKQALSNPKNTVDTWEGEPVIVKKRAPVVHHRRQLGWTRQMASTEKSLVGRDAVQRGLQSLAGLSRLDAAAEPGFAGLGGRLLKPPGSLPALPDQASDAPLPLQPRVASDPPLSQESADGSERRSSGARSATPGGPSSSAGATQRLALRKHEVLAEFVAVNAALQKTQKVLKKIADDKRCQAITTADKDLLGLDSLSKRHRGLMQAIGGQKTTLQHAKLEELQAKIDGAATFVQTARDLVAEVEAAAALAQKIFASTTAAARAARMAENKESKKRLGQVTKAYEDCGIPNCIRAPLGICLEGQLGGNILQLVDRTPDMLLMPAMFARGSALGQAWHTSGWGVFDRNFRGVLKTAADFLTDEVQEQAAVIRVKWNHQEPRGAGWWETVAQPLNLPSSLAPNAAAALLHPWLVTVRGGCAASGPQNLPLFGSGSILLGLAGSCWLLLSKSELVDRHEGFLAATLAEVRPCEVSKWLTSKKWQHCLVSPGDVVHVPRGWSAFLLGTIQDDGIYPSVILLPTLRMDPWDWENDAQAFNHICAGNALNINDAGWQDVQSFARLFQVAGTGSQISQPSQLPLTDA